MDAIVAVYADWGIGAKGTQPLVIPADRRRFRELTMGAAVIVGRRTLDDFPGGRPLPGRENLVLTRQNIVIEGAQVVHSPAEAAAAAAQYDRCFVIGGDSVFRQMFPHLMRVYVTKIDTAPHSDVFFRIWTPTPRGAAYPPSRARSTTAWAISFACTKKQKHKKPRRVCRPQAEKSAIIFSRDMCVRENTSQTASLLSGKPPVFPTNSKPPLSSSESGGFFCLHPVSTVSESALMHMWKNTGGQIERVCS